MLTTEELTELRNDFLFLEAPEFLTTEEQKLKIINYHLNNSNNDTNKKLFGSEVKRAVVLLTAHKLTISNALNLDTALLKRTVGSVTKQRNKNEKTEKETWFSSGNKTNSNKNIPVEFEGSIYGASLYSLKMTYKSRSPRILLV